ncbi:hypothetical protein HDV03_001258 [Kappamyces sp. JEL0829]|nr:hypothetical protein HDV03_001258 [Kappamyces sp. JEL0829]KAJ3368381.1 hypothetical protein HDU91_000617 [Kappamyces sp. JEL0680]
MATAPGEWTSFDDITWAASNIISVIFLIPLALEVAIRFRWTKHWVAVVVSILLIVGRIVSLGLYLHTSLSDSDIDVTKAYQSFSIFEILTGVMSNLAMYQRKTLFTPQDYGYLDEIVFLICCVLYVLGGTFDFMAATDSSAVWSFTSYLLGSGYLLNMLYFDLYYIYRFTSIVLGSKKTMTWTLALPLLLPVCWTFLLSFLYLIGTEMYRNGTANFYSNALWNISSCVYCISTLQSNISSQAILFLFTIKHFPDIVPSNQAVIGPSAEVPQEIMPQEAVHHDTQLVHVEHPVTSAPNQQRRTSLRP